MERQNINSGAPWEAQVGYSRAVRVGPFVYIAGTSASDTEGRVLAPGDPYGQAVAIFRKIADALAAADASLEDVVRTRMYLTNIDDWKQVGRAHAEFFGEIRPTATLVAVDRLLDPEMLVEIEVDAVIAE